MNKNEIEKELYKQKPKAHLDYIRSGVAYYKAILNNKTLIFEVPVNDMGIVDFESIMDAQLLIRWLVYDEK